MVSSSLLSLASVLLLFAYVVTSSPVDNARRREYAVKSSRPTPRKWKRIDVAPLDHMLQLQIGLKQSRIDDLLQHVDEGMLATAIQVHP
jgi:tripeptidyl-peptidase-1